MLAYQTKDANPCQHCHRARKLPQRKNVMHGQCVKQPGHTAYVKGCVWFENGAKESIAAPLLGGFKASGFNHHNRIGPAGCIYTCTHKHDAGHLATSGDLHKRRRPWKQAGYACCPGKKAATDGQQLLRASFLWGV
jgi:hypothetical protein